MISYTPSSNKKGIKVSIDRPIERIDRSSATFKSQIVSYKQKLALARQDQLQSSHTPYNNLVSPVINSARNQRLKTGFFGLLNQPQKQLKNQFQQPSQKYTQSTYKPYKFNHSYQDIRTRQNDSDYQSPRLNYLVKKPIHQLGYMKSLDQKKNEICQEKQSRQNVKYQELQLQEVKKKLKILQDEKIIQNTELQQLKSSKRQNQVKHINLQIDFKRVNKQKSQIQKNLQFYQSQATSLKQQLRKIKIENLQQKIRIKNIQQKLKDCQLIIDEKNDEKNKLIEKYKNMTETYQRNQQQMKMFTKEKSSLTKQVQEGKQKIKKLNEQKRILIQDYKKLNKIKQFVKNAQQSDANRLQQIKLHIAYQVQLMQQNQSYKQELNRHQNDLQLSRMQYHSLSSEIQGFNNQIQQKLKKVIGEKKKLQDELLQAKNQTQRIRKQMFNGYQQIIEKLRNQIIELKQENINLSNNSQFKIQVIKLQRDNKILNNKIQDLHKRNKELQENYQKVKSQKTTLSSELSINSNNSDTCFNIFDGQFGSILRSYESRGLDLNQRIQQKQTLQKELKVKVQKLQIQNQELKGRQNLMMRKVKSNQQNSKNKLENLQYNLKKDIESLTRKISTQEDTIRRKNKQIQDKDKFMTGFLLSKIKQQKEVQKIIQQISTYFK